MEQNQRHRLNQRHHLIVETNKILRRVQFSPVEEAVEEKGGAFGLGPDGVEALVDIDVDLFDSLRDALEGESFWTRRRVEAFDRLRP